CHENRSSAVATLRVAPPHPGPLRPPGRRGKDPRSGRVRWGRATARWLSLQSRALGSARWRNHRLTWSGRCWPRDRPRRRFAMSVTAASTTPARADTAQLLRGLGIADTAFATGNLIVRSPINGAELARLPAASRADVERTIGAAHGAFLGWRSVPAPRRGELVRRF